MSTPTAIWAEEHQGGEYFHSLLQSLIASTLVTRESERRYRAFIRPHVRVTDAPRYRIPDLCVKALPHQVTPALTAPDLVIEIISRDDDPTAVLLSVADFHQGGVPYVWVVDPHKRVLVESVNGQVRVPDGQILSTPLVGDVDFAELFAQLDEPAE